MDEVFKALADPSRRLLLDALHDRDGQTLTELCRVLPEVTRFAVMKHVAVLEGAGLVVARKDGREKHHFLNPVPIQEIADRWIAKYSRPMVRGIVDLKRDLESASATEGAACRSTSTRPTSARRRTRSGTR